MAIYPQRSVVVSVRAETSGETEIHLEFCVGGGGYRTAVGLQQLRFLLHQFISVREEDVRFKKAVRSE